MYKVNRYKFISELHRKLIKLPVSSCHTISTAENRSFLNNLPTKLETFNKSDLKQLNSEYSALLKLFSRSFSIPQYAIARFVCNFIDDKWCYLNAL